jgi:transposase-like protein
MPKSYPPSVRRAVLNHYFRHGSIRATSARFNISPTTLQRWLRLAKAPRTPVGGWRRPIEILLRALRLKDPTAFADAVSRDKNTANRIIQASNILDSYLKQQPPKGPTWRRRSTGR